MKRMHIHLAVDELSESIGFYATIFGASPTLEREDYAKWQLDDPKVNFAISVRGGGCGMNHLGIQVDSDAELQEIAQRLENAEIKHSTQQGTSCCHSRSDKHWALDPQGIAWESFRSLNADPVVAGSAGVSSEESSSCCIPLSTNDSSDQQEVCCIPDENDASGCCA